MENKDTMQFFENKKIRSVWDAEKEEWFFSIVDVVAVLTESRDPTAYWRKLKQRLKDEGNQTVTNCHALKMIAKDGKKTSDRCCRHGAGSQNHPVHPFTQSRTL